VLWVSYRDLFGLLYRQGPTQGEFVIGVTLSSPQGYNFPVPKLISKVRRVMDAHRFDDARQDMPSSPVNMERALMTPQR
jgi:hypothetical protein